MIKYSLTNCDSTLGENIKYLMHKYKFDMHQWYGSITSLLIGYEPAGRIILLPVHYTNLSYCLSVLAQLTPH